MAEFTEAHFKRSLEEAKERFADGFQASDLAWFAFKLASFARVFTLTRNERRALALRLGGAVIDEVDLPGPDALWDPVLKALLPGLVDFALEHLEDLEL